MDSKSNADSTILDEAESFVQETQRALSKARGGKDDVRREVQKRLNELRHRIEDEDPEAVAEKLEETREFVDAHLEVNEKGAVREYAESIGLAILFALLLRGFVIEAFKIPTKSMVPTLKVGDHLFVNKFTYGIRVPFTQTFLTRFQDPERGEVVVFTFPRDGARNYVAKQPPSERGCIDANSLHEEKDFIKRIVGVGGDKVEIKNNQLMINGEAVRRTFLRKETTGNFLYPHEVHEMEHLNDHHYRIKYAGSNEDFGPIKVKPGHVFVVGDNRDNSSDSRCWGQVPVENIKGRAMIIWWSIGPNSIRWDRIGQVIN